MSRNVLLTLRKEQSYSRARVLNKIVCMADKVPVYSVLNTVFVISRKRSIMRRAFVIFLAISFLAFSLDGRFVYFDQVLDGRSAGSCSRTAVNNGAYGRIDLKRLTILPDKNIKSPSENSSRSRSKNLLLTGREGRTGEYWPEIVAVRTERSEVRTKTTEGQYSPVRLELARLVSSLLYGTRAMLVLNLPAFENKKIHSR